MNCQHCDPKGSSNIKLYSHIPQIGLRMILAIAIDVTCTSWLGVGSQGLAIEL